MKWNGGEEGEGKFFYFLFFIYFYRIFPLIFYKIVKTLFKTIQILIINRRP